MISQFCIDVPCRCGQTHKVPLDLQGRWVAVCPRLGKASQMNCDAQQFATLQAQHAAEDVNVDKVWTVHRAAGMKDDMQRCEDCGVVLLNYRKWQRRMKAFGVAWWKPGMLVGADGKGNFYMALKPLSPLRERRCYQVP